MADPKTVAAWVRSSCEAQGIPEKVTDVAALREIGVLLGVGAGQSRADGA